MESSGGESSSQRRAPAPQGGYGGPRPSGWASWLILLGAAALIPLLILWGRPLYDFFGQVARVRRFVASFGPWPPLTLIALEVVQVVLAPMPGGMIDLASGYLFGPGWGTLYSMTGLMGGTVITMWLSRRFGRPLAQRLIPSSTLERLDRYAGRRGALFFLLLFLTPFIPNDVLCLLAGLTSLPMAKLVFIAAIGRFPGVLVANLMGANAAALTPRQLLVIGVPLLLVTVAVWRFRESIEDSLLRLLARLEALVRR